MGVRHVLAGGGIPPVLAQAAGGAVGDWWLGPWPGFPLATAIPAANCVAAYRAVATVGSAWGAGPTSLAESYVNLANPGTYDLTLGIAPAWNDASGWDFTGLEYLKTGVIPTSLPGWSMFVQYTDLTVLTQTYLCGEYDSVFPQGYLAILYRTGGFNSMTVFSGGTSGQLANNAPALVSGNYAICNLSPYRDGVIEGNLVPNNFASSPNLDIYIGSHNRDGIPTNNTTAKIRALAIYNIEINSNQAAALGTAGTGAMAQL